MLKGFRIRILVRIVLITCMIGLMLYFAIIEKRYLRSIYLFIFTLIAIGELVWYVDRTNRDIASFLTALLQHDFTTTFSQSKKGRSFNTLYAVFNKITKKFKEISAEKQAQHIYLETLVEHVKVGIISFDEQEKIHLMNDTFKQTVGKSTLLYLKSLGTVSKELVVALREIKPGDQQLVKISVNNNLLQLAVHASSFKLQDKLYKLVSIQNIKNELEDNELDAWKKLIRVLTHEIMNSVTPISSLSETLSQLAAGENRKQLPDPSVMIKLQQGLEAIRSRSEGLQSFTQAYRSLTRIPTPTFEEVNIYELIQGIEMLFAEELKATTIDIVASDTHIISTADPSLLEQVFINLLKNALDAVANERNPKITITITRHDKIRIQIADNGEGIDEDKLDKIFVPFFTTKASGSGIGLALSREIIRQHKGAIAVHSVKDEGTVFTVTL